MEPVFTTETIHDRTVHKEFRDSMKYASPLWWIVYLLGVGMVAWYITKFEIRRIIWIFLGLTAWLLFFHFLRNRKGGDIPYRRMLQDHGGKPMHTRIELDADGIHSTDMDNGNRYHYRYDQILSIVESSNLLILCMKYSSCLILDKRWIKGGSAESMTGHLFSHCTKIKRKRLRKPAIGIWCHRIFVGAMVVGVIAALCHLPKVSLLDKLSGKLTNEMSYSQMAEELAKLDITITDRTIAEMEAYDAEYLREYGVDFYSDGYYSKIYDLLYWEGAGVWEEETWIWTPSASGIFWWDLEVYYVDAIYTDFFAGLNAMHPELGFENIEEDYTAVDFEAGTGTVVVSFDYNSLHYRLEAEYDQDWFDTRILSDISGILAADPDPRDLYCSYDGQGVLIYYGTAVQAQLLEKLSGLDFYVEH